MGMVANKVPEVTPVMAAWGRVWTAPWQEVSGVFRSIGRVRSRVRPVDAAGAAAGSNALRGSNPNREHALGSAVTQAGSLDPSERPYLHYVVMPSPVRIACG